MRLKSPCMDCPECGCGAKHDTCGAYLAYVADRQEASREKMEAFDTKDYCGRRDARIKRKMRRLNMNID